MSVSTMWAPRPRRMIGVVFAALMLVSPMPHAQGLDALGLAMATQALTQGQFQHVLNELPALEAALGKNPRIESLRAQALAGLGRTEEALKSVLLYEQGVAGRLDARHPGHADMMGLKASLQSQLRTEIALRKEERQRHRRAAADETGRQIAAESSQVERQREAAQKRFDARIRSAANTLSSEDLAYLIATESGTQFEKADARALALRDFRPGALRLGLPQDEFERWLLKEVRSIRTEDKLMRQLATDFEIVYHVDESASRARNASVSSFDTPSRESGSSVHAFALGRYGNPHRFQSQVRGLHDAIRSMAAASPELKKLVPGVASCHLEKLVFTDRVVTFMFFECLYPPAFNQVKAPHDHLARTFGPPSEMQDGGVRASGSRTVSSIYRIPGGLSFHAGSTSHADARGERPPMTIRLLFSGH